MITLTNLEGSIMISMKKRIGIIMAALVLAVSSGAVALTVFAQDYIPMPALTGWPDTTSTPRFMREIYEMYVNQEVNESGDVIVTEDVFAEYLTYFDISSQVNAVVDPQFRDWYTRKDADGKSGITDLEIKSHHSDYFTFKLAMYEGAYNEEESANNVTYLYGFDFAANKPGYKSFVNARSYSGFSRTLVPSYTDTVPKQIYGELAHVPRRSDGKYTWLINAKGTLSGMAFYAMDKNSPGTKGWKAYLSTAGDAAYTVYQLRLENMEKDKLRPANKEIAYEELEQYQLNVTMKNTTGGESYVIPAKCVDVSGTALIFEFYDDENKTWSSLQDGEGMQLQVTSIQALDREVEEYDIYDIYYMENLTDKFGIQASAPITDMAGNSTSFGSDTKVMLGEKLIMDRRECRVTEVNISPSNIDRNNTSGEASWEEMFTATYDFIGLEIKVDEHLIKEGDEYEAAKNNVYAVWNIYDSQGNPLKSKLRSIWNGRDGNGKAYSELYFEYLEIDNGMTPQGQRIMVQSIEGADYIYDLAGNNGIQNPVLITGSDETTIFPDYVTYLDTKAPSAEVGDAVVRYKLKDEDGKVEKIQITVPLTVTDFASEVEGGVVAGASGTTAGMSVFGMQDDIKLKYRYAVTQSVDYPEEDEATWHKGVMTEESLRNWANFGIGKDGEPVYIHMELSELSGIEIGEREGINLQMLLHDNAKNYTWWNGYADRIQIQGVDNCAPELQLSGRDIVKTMDGCEVSLNAHAYDINGITSLSYRWVDSEDGTEPYTDIKYEQKDDGYYAANADEALTFEISLDEESGDITKILQVQAYDKMGNMAETSTSVTVNLAKAVSQFDVEEDLNIPSATPSVTVYSPEALGVEEVSATAMSRVTLHYEILDEDNVWQQEIYYRFITAEEAEDGAELFDYGDDITWYKVEEYSGDEEDGYSYSEFTEVEGTPGWAEYYGNMDVYIASTLKGWINSETGELVPGYALQHLDDNTYSYEKIGTVAHAPEKEDVYSLNYVGEGNNNTIYVQDAYGTQSLALGYYEEGSNELLYRYGVFNHELAGVKVDVELENTLVEDWGVEDIDFEKSYAVLVKADKSGNIVTDAEGNYVEASARQSLSKSLTQTLSVPVMDKNNEAYTTGAYTWVVCVVQKGGAEQIFDDCELYLLLDDVAAPDNFGVLSYDRQIDVIKGLYASNGQPITISTAEEEGVLSVVDIGIAEPSHYLDQSNITIHEVDGIEAYSTAVFNSLESQGSSLPVAKLQITADMSAEEEYGTWLGQALGEVEGIRFWNKASMMNEEGLDGTVNYIMADRSYQDSGDGVYASFSSENGKAVLDLSFACGWYAHEEYSYYASCIVSEEELAERSAGDFGLVLGSNTICYQLKMANGTESSVYQFELNLHEEAPEVEVEFEYGPYYEEIVQHVDNNWNYIPTKVRYAEYINVKFDNIISNYGGQKVYLFEYPDYFEDPEYTGDGATEYTVRELTPEELTNGCKITKGCGAYNYDDGYDGYKGTGITTASGQWTHNGTELFFMVVDASGNATCIYPFNGVKYYEQRYGTHYEIATPFMTRAEYEGFDEEDNVHSISAGVNMGYSSEVEVQLDDKEPYILKLKDENGEDCFQGIEAPNNAGMVSYDDYTFDFVTEYDPELEEDAVSTHNMKVTLRGNPTGDGQYNYEFTRNFEFEAKNIKPTVVDDITVAGALGIAYNVPIVNEYGEPDYVEYVPLTDDMYGTTYEHEYLDMFENGYTENIQIGSAEDLRVSIEYSNTDATTEPVMVTIKSTVEGEVLSVNEDDWIVWNYNEDTGIYESSYREEYENITGAGTSEMTVVLNSNHQFDVFDETTWVGYVNVSNIYESLTAKPYVAWSYDAGDVQDGVVYGEVTAYLADKNGLPLIDPATGKPATYVFQPGCEKGDSYTFTGCYCDLTGEKLPDITATLEVDVEPVPMPWTDTFAPDVDVVSYVTKNGKATEAGKVYRQLNGDEARFNMTDYAYDFGENCYYEDLTDMVAGLGWADSYMFHLDVYDESKVKLILRKELYEDNINYKTSSETIVDENGNPCVKLVGRTLEITANAEFVLYLVDEENNVTAVYFKVTTLGVTPPAPEIAQVQAMDENGNPTIRVYLLPPQLEEYEDLKLTNAEGILAAEAELDEEVYKYEGDDEALKAEFELISDYKDYYYMEYNTSGTYTLYYSYVCPDYMSDPIKGSFEVTVTMPDMSKPAIAVDENNKQMLKWSENYNKNTTNQDITCQIQLTKKVKDISVVEVKDNNETLIANTMLKDAGITVTWFEDKLTIIYEKNTAELLSGRTGSVSLKLKALDNNQVGYIVLPEVSNIDKTAPVLTVTEEDVKYSDNHRSAEITVTANESVTCQTTGKRGTTFTYKVKENAVGEDAYSYSYVDNAGNKAGIAIEVTDILTEELAITLSKSASEAGIIASPADELLDIGSKVYVRTNRRATVSMLGEEDAENPVTANENSWAELTISENAVGVHPTIVAEDEYGNTAMVQLERIPLRDITRPNIIIEKQMVTVSVNATEDDIKQALLDNIIYSDDTTATGDLIVEVDYLLNETSNRYPVTYTVTDEAGNFVSGQCWLRIRNGLAPAITANGVEVEDGAFIYLREDSLTLSVDYTAEVAEQYKLVYEKGRQDSWAKLKNGTWLTDGYEDKNSMTYTLDKVEDGWYSFAIVTQGAEVYYFQIHFGDV